MAKREEDILSRLLTPSRKEQFFTKIKKEKVKEFELPLEDMDIHNLCKRTRQLIRHSMMVHWQPVAMVTSPMTWEGVTGQLIDNSMKKAHCPLNADQKQTHKEYARELIEAKGQVDDAAGILETDPNNLEARRQLEEAVLQLQGLVLQGPPSFRILVEYVKELSEEVDQLIAVNDSCAIESEKEINNLCGEIKIEADRILQNYNATDVDGLSIVPNDVIDEFVAFEKAAEKRMEFINQIIQWLPDCKDRILLNSKFVDLQGKRIKLRFAAQSITAANRLVHLDNNFKDILNVEDKIKKGILPGIHCREELILEAFPRSASSVILQAMLSLDSQRQLGTALMKFVDDLLSAEHSAQCCLRQQLQEKFENPINMLKKLLMMVRRKVIYWENYHDADVTRTMEKVLEAVSKVCVCPMERRNWNQFDFCLLKTNLRVISQAQNEESKIEDLQVWATHITQLMVRLIHSVSTGQHTIDFTHFLSEVNCLAWTIQSLKRNDDPAFDASIEEAVRQIIVQTLDLVDTYERPEVNTKKQEQLVIEGRSEDIITEDMIPEECRMTSGPLKVRPPASTTFRAAVSVGAIPGRSIPAEDSIVYDNPISLESENPFELPVPFQSSITTSGRYKTTDCAAQYEKPVYARGSGSGGSGDSSSVQGGSGGGEASGHLVEGSASDSGVGSSSSGGQGDLQRSTVSGYLPPDLTISFVYCLQVIDAFRRYNEFINNLCRDLSRNILRFDCGELLRNLLLQQATLQCRQPTCTLSYQDCWDKLQTHQDIIPMLTSDDPMTMVAFWRNLRFVSAAACKSSDLAAQCAYLILVSESDTETAKIGVVDVIGLQNLLKGGQTICYKMLSLQPDEAKEQSFRFVRQVQHIVKALSEAGKKVKGLKLELDKKILEVHKCAMELSGSFEHSELDEGDGNANYQHRISAATLQMLNCLKAVNKMTEHPALMATVPADRNLSDDAQNRSDQVLRNAKLLAKNALMLVQEVKTRSDYVAPDETIRWSAFDHPRRAVLRAYGELLDNVRSIGQQANFLV